MAPNYFSNIALQNPKRMRSITQEEPRYEVYVSIPYAEDIDSATRNPNGDARIYRVLGWIDPGKEFFSRIAEGLPNPVWNMRHMIYLGENGPSQYLHLEVLRVGCTSDPGTSRRVALVGRARIALPEIGRKISGRYGLVMPNGLAEGHITVTMELRRTKHDYFRRVH